MSVGGCDVTASCKYSHCHKRETNSTALVDPNETNLQNKTLKSITTASNAFNKHASIKKSFYDKFTLIYFDFSI